MALAKFFFFSVFGSEGANVQIGTKMFGSYAEADPLGLLPHMSCTAAGHCIYCRTCHVR